MPALNRAYNVEDLPESANVLIPDGDYNVRIEETAIKASKANEANVYLEVAFKIIDACDYEGFVVRSRPFLEAEKEFMVQRGLAELRQILIACGMTSIRNSEELEGMKLKVTIGTDKGKNSDYGPSNVVKKYSAYEGIGGGFSSASSAPSAQSAPSATPAKKRPW